MGDGGANQFRSDRACSRGLLQGQSARESRGRSGPRGAWRGRKRGGSRNRAAGIIRARQVMEKSSRALTGFGGQRDSRYHSAGGSAGRGLRRAQCFPPPLRARRKPEQGSSPKPGLGQTADSERISLRNFRFRPGQITLLERRQRGAGGGPSGTRAGRRRPPQSNGRLFPLPAANPCTIAQVVEGRRPQRDPGPGTQR